MKRLAICLLLASIGLLGCSSDDPDTQTLFTTTTTTVEQTIEARVRAYASAVLQNRATEAYAMWSDRCKTTETETDFATQVAGQVLTNRNARLLTVDVRSVDRDNAVVVNTWDTPSLGGRGQSWHLERGLWHMDDCTTLGVTTTTTAAPTADRR